MSKFDEIRIFPDGDMWCALIGPDLQEGVAGFGTTPEQALHTLIEASKCNLPVTKPVTEKELALFEFAVKIPDGPEGWNACALIDRTAHYFVNGKSLCYRYSLLVKPGGDDGLPHCKKCEENLRKLHHRRWKVIRKTCGWLACPYLNRVGCTLDSNFDGVCPAVSGETCVQTHISSE